MNCWTSNWNKFNSEKPEEDGCDDEYPLRWQVLMALPHFTIHKLTSAVADFPGPPKKKEACSGFAWLHYEVADVIKSRKSREEKVVLTSLQTVSGYSHIY